MKIKLVILILLISFFVHSTIQAQTDTIYTFKEKISCIVKEVTPDAVKYAYPGEEALNLLPSNQIIKILFRSGRVQNFSSSPILKKVRYVVDYQNVLVTSKETDVYGLKKFSEISAIAWYGTPQDTRNRALNHLKIIAAMLGYKAILKTFDENGIGGRGNYMTNEAQVSGIPYSDSIPTLNQFYQKVGVKNKFKAVSKHILKRNGLSNEVATGHFHIERVFDKDGIVYFFGHIGAHEGNFRLVYLGPDFFVLCYVGTEHIFNFEVSYF